MTGDDQMQNSQPQKHNNSSSTCFSQNTPSNDQKQPMTLDDFVKIYSAMYVAAKVSRVSSKLDSIIRRIPELLKNEQ